MPTHDEICEKAVRASDEASLDAVVAAFVDSLASRNLPARSAFGSYVVLQHFAPHDFIESRHFSAGNCAVCGLPKRCKDSMSDERIARYPFQVRHTDIEYAAHDLATFSKRALDLSVNVTADAVDILRQIFEVMSALPANAQLGDLHKCLQIAIKSNKNERMILLETLGYAGILCPGQQQNYSDVFVTYDNANLRQPANFYKREWSYPVRFWTSADGVNQSKVARYFSRFL